MNRVLPKSLRVFSVATLLAVFSLVLTGPLSALAATHTFNGVILYTPIYVTSSGGRYEPAGLFQATDGSTAYCIDFYKDFFDANYTSTGPITDAHILYIIAHFFPTGPSTFGGGNNGYGQEAGAVQLAIWHYTDGVTITNATLGSGGPDVTAAIQNRTNQIIAAANAAGVVANPVVVTTPASSYDLNTMTPPPSVPVTVHVYESLGGPVANGTAVAITSTAGTTLNGSPGVPGITVTTTGGVATATLSNLPLTPAGSVTITATSDVVYYFAFIYGADRGGDLAQRVADAHATFTSTLTAGATTITTTASATPGITKAVADLTPDHTASGTSIIAYRGDLLQFTLNCSNTGLLATPPGTVTDNLNTNANMSTLTGIVQAGGISSTNVGGLLTWLIPAIPAGGSCSVSFTGTVPSSAPNALHLDNCGVYNAPNATQSNCVHVVIHAPTPGLTKAVADLTPGHLASGTSITAYAGDQLKFTLSCSNTGTVATPPGTVTDDLNASANTNMATLTDITLSGGLSSNNDDGLLTWHVAAVPPAGFCSVSFTGNVPTDTSNTYHLDNCGIYHSPTPTPSNCVHVATVIPGLTKAVADLTAGHTASGNSIVAYAGDQLKFTLNCSNTGTVATPPGAITDDLNASANTNMSTLTSIALSGGISSTNVAGLLTWFIPAVPAGGSCSVSFTGTIPLTTTTAIHFDNHGVYTAGSIASSNFVHVRNVIPVLVKKVTDLTPGHLASGTAITVYGGDKLQFDLTCSNTGSGTSAQGVIVDDFNATTNSNLTKLTNVVQFGGTTPTDVAGLLTWRVGPIVPLGPCAVGFTALVPSPVTTSYKIDNCAVLESSTPGHVDTTSNCVHVTVALKPVPVPFTGGRLITPSPQPLALTASLLIGGLLLFLFSLTFLYRRRRRS